MLTHIVVWKYRTDVEQFAREEHVTLLRNLASIIPEVQSLAAGFDTLFLPVSYERGRNNVSKPAARLCTSGMIEARLRKSVTCSSRANCSTSVRYFQTTMCVSIFLETIRVQSRNSTASAA